MSLTQTIALMGHVVPANGILKVAEKLAVMFVLAYFLALTAPHVDTASMMTTWPTGLKERNSTVMSWSALAASSRRYVGKPNGMILSLKFVWTAVELTELTGTATPAAVRSENTN